MAGRINIGGSYLVSIPKSVITRRGVLHCFNCNEEIEAEHLAIGKRRGGRKVKHYCLKCAITLNVITHRELSKAMTTGGYTGYEMPPEPM